MQITQYRSIAAGQARLRTPDEWAGLGAGRNCGGEDRLCVRWDAQEVGHSYTSDSLFVVTRVKATVDSDDRQKIITK